MSDQSDWERQVSEKRKRQAQTIPQEWLIHTPPEDQTNVLDVPEMCGLRTPQELEITRTTDVATLLSNIASGLWSCVEVTTAFCKRAIIAHQVVSFAASYNGEDLKLTFL